MYPYYCLVNNLGSSPGTLTTKINGGLNITIHYIQNSAITLSCPNGSIPFFRLGGCHMAKQTHLSKEEQSTIQTLLKDKFSFKAIAKDLGRDCTTVSKEIKGHRCFKKTGAYGRSFNDYLNRMTWSERNICNICTNKTHRSSEKGSQSIMFVQAIQILSCIAKGQSITI